MFDGSDFLSTMSSIPAVDGNLFHHERFLNKTLSQHVFTGRRVFVQSDKLLGLTTVNDVGSRTIRVKVEAVCADQALVTPDIPLRNQLSGQFISIYEMTIDDSTYDVNEALRDILNNDRNLLKSKLLEFIRIGDFFELQEKNSLVMHTVKILANYNGFVDVVDEAGGREVIHITSIRCRPFGWSRTAIAQKNGYVLADEMVNDKSIRATAPWLFEYATLKEHNFWPGMLLEAIDPASRMMFYPAIVTERHNKHFFSVRLVCDLSSDAKLKNSPKIEMCHLDSTDIFPMGWCSKNGIRLTLPKGLENSSLTNLWSILRTKLNNLNIIVKEMPIFITDSLLEIPKPIGKIEAMRYCEYLSHYDKSAYGKPVFVPAIILRCTKHLIWISPDDDDLMVAPKIYSFTSDRLFRWGFAESAQLDFIINRSLLTHEMRYDMTAKYSSQRTSIFQNQKKNFMSEVWLNNQMWLHRVYVNKSCFCGPFLNSEKIERLCNSYSPGPLPLTISAIIKDLVFCGNRLQQVLDILQANKGTILPTLHIPLKKAGRRSQFHIEVCQQTCEFAGWLQNVLRRLDACPNLLSVMEMKDGKCSAKCSMVALFSYMKSDSHPNTNTACSAQQKYLILQQKRRQISDDQSNSASTAALNITVAEKTPTAKRISAPRQLDNNSSQDEDEEEVIVSPDSRSDRSSNHNISCVSPTDYDNNINTTIGVSDGVGNGGIEAHSEAVMNSDVITPKQPIGRRTRNSSTKSTSLPLKTNTLISFENECVLAQPNGSPPIELPGCNSFGTRLVSVSDERFTLAQQQNGQRSSKLATLWKATSSPPSPPSKRLKHCHPVILSNPMNWTCEELCGWIVEADPRLKDIAKQLMDEEVDGEAIMMFKQSTFSDMGIKLGPAVKILALVEELKKSAVKNMEHFQ